MRFVLKSGVFLMLLCLMSHSNESSAQTSRGKGVPLESLPQELSALSPKDYFLPSSEKKVGVVHALEGTVVVIHGTTKDGYFAAAGDAVFEKDSLVTLAQSKCRIRFADENVVTMAPETEFSVESFVDQREEGSKSSFFRMVKGRAMFYALRLFRYKDSRVTLATPTNTIGVRGTKFGAHVYYLENPKTASNGILVADARNDIVPYLAQAGTGQSFTDCFSEDGVLDVDGRAVSPGQMFSGRTGQVIPTPPDVIRSFQQATEIRTEGATGQPPAGAGAEGEAPPPPPPVSVTGGVAPVFADIQANITSFVQQQTVKEIEQKQITKDPPPRRDIGYFSAMLTNITSGTLTDVFIQFEDHVQYRTDVLRALGLGNSQNVIEGKDWGGYELDITEPYLSRIYLGASADSGSLDKSHDMNDTPLGRNDYMEWGYWTMTTPVTIAGAEYAIDNRAYYVVGQATENLDRVRNLGNVTYTGTAHGTYFDATGGANMSGTFMTQVNFNSGSVHDFNLSVATASGPPRSASISGASGAIYDYANLGNNSCGHFDINPATGVWTLNGAAAVNKAAQGALYGPNGEYIGGVWGMYNSTEGAAGVFQGSR